MMKLSLLLLCFSLSAMAKDVINKIGPSFIQVEVKQVQNREYRSFTFHQQGKHSRTLGKKLWYDVEELMDQRLEEKVEVLYSALADIGIIAGGLLTGGLVEALLVGSVGAGGGAIPFIGPLLGASGMPIILGKLVDGLNPFKQYQQQNSLRSEVIADKEVILQNEEELYYFAQTLDFVLRKIQ